MAMSGGDVGGLSSTPNVTPLIDVLLVLLIIFMVITPTTPHGLDALVPQPPKNPQTRTITTAPSLCRSRLSRWRAGLQDQRDRCFPWSASAAVGGDLCDPGDQGDVYQRRPESRLGRIADVIDIGHQANVDHIGVITPKIAAGQ